MELAFQTPTADGGWLVEAFDKWGSLLPQTWSDAISARSVYVQGMCARTDYLTTLKNRLDATTPGNRESEELILDSIISARALVEHRQLRKAMLLAEMCLQAAEGHTLLTHFAKLTLAGVYLSFRKFAEAEKLLQECVPAESVLTPTQGIIGAAAHSLLCSLFLQVEPEADLKAEAAEAPEAVASLHALKAITLYEFHIWRIASTTKTAQAAALATIYSWKGTADQRRQNYTEAVRWQEKAAETTEKLLDQSHPLRFETARALAQAKAAETHLMTTELKRTITLSNAAVRAAAAEADHTYDQPAVSWTSTWSVPPQPLPPKYRLGDLLWRRRPTDPPAAFARVLDDAERWRERGGTGPSGEAELAEGTRKLLFGESRNAHRDAACVVEAGGIVLAWDSLRALLKLPHDAWLLCSCPHLTDVLQSEWGLNVSCIVPAASTSTPDRAHAVVDAIRGLPMGSVLVMPLIAGANLAPMALEVATALAQRRIVPIFDAAYLGTTLPLEDATLLFRLVDVALPLSVVVFPLTWVLPSDPLEVVHVMCASADSCARATEQIRKHARALQSAQTPVQVFATVFTEKCLVSLFETQAMLFGKRISERRAAFAKRLDSLECPGNWEALAESQAGPWLCSAIPPDECSRLVEDGIEMPRSGFISLPALDTDQLAEEIRDSLLRARAEKGEALVAVNR